MILEEYFLCEQIPANAANVLLDVLKLGESNTIPMNIIMTYHFKMTPEGMFADVCLQTYRTSMKSLPIKPSKN